MFQIKWDQVGEKTYETGVDHGVLYPQSNGEYPKGFAWNGLTNVTESPSGAENNDIYADNIKYLTLKSAENFGVTLECYTYPEEWAPCDGKVEVAKGVTIGQQPRKNFGLSYRTIKGNDTEGDTYGYKLHLVYNCSASPSEQAYSTVNDSPEALTFSYEVATTPVPVNNQKPTACLIIDSTSADPEKLKALEQILYGSDETGSVTDARLPMPDEVISLFAAG